MKMSSSFDNFRRPFVLNRLLDAAAPVALLNKVTKENGVPKDAIMISCSEPAPEGTLLSLSPGGCMAVRGGLCCFYLSR